MNGTQSALAPNRPSRRSLMEVRNKQGLRAGVRIKFCTPNYPYPKETYVVLGTPYQQDESWWVDVLPNSIKKPTGHLQYSLADNGIANYKDGRWHQHNWAEYVSVWDAFIGAILSLI